MPDRYLGRQIGKYRVIRLIGGGAFAWVYEAIDRDLEIPVALKVLRPEFAGDPTAEARFRREASTAARLRHRNIVIVRDVGQIDGASFVAMDLLRGSLGQRLRTKAVLPERDVVRVGLDVAAALAVAHNAGVIHRDIKPDNILFGPGAEAVVADFGLARALSGDSGLSATNQVMGTPHYFSPEQARGLVLDGRTDLYSLGVTLYRAATGRLPFDGDDWYVVGRQHIEAEVPRPSTIEASISGAFEAVLLRLLAKNPEDRFPSAEVVVSALSALPSASGEQDRQSTGSMSVTQGPVSAFVTRAPVPMPSPSVAAIAVAARSPSVVASASRRGWYAMGVAALLVVVAGALVSASRSDAAWWARLSGRAVVDPTAHLRDSLAIDSAAKEMLRDSLLDSKKGAVSTVATKPETLTGGLDAPFATGALIGRLELRTVDEAELFVDDTRVGVGSWKGERATDRPVHARAILRDAPSGCASATKDSTFRLKASERAAVLLRVRSCGELKFDVVPADSYLQFVPRDGGAPIRLRADTASGTVLAVGRYDVVANYPRCAEYRDTINVVRTVPGDSMRVRVRMICNIGFDDVSRR